MRSITTLITIIAIARVSCAPLDTVNARPKQEQLEQRWVDTQGLKRGLLTMPRLPGAAGIPHPGGPAHYYSRQPGPTAMIYSTYTEQRDENENEIVQR